MDQTTRATDARETYDLHAFHSENRAVLAMTAAVRADAGSADRLGADALDPDLLDTLVADVGRFAAAFTHYRHKEELVLPHLEARGVRELSAGMWEGDNRVRSFVGTAVTLLPGARERPSSGNLQSVAGLLLDACDHADSMVAEEESELVPLMRSTLGDADWERISADAALVPAVEMDEPRTWGPSALDMAEARLRALGGGGAQDAPSGARP